MTLFFFQTACHRYATRMCLYVVRMSLVCTRMSFVCHSYVLIFHPYVTRMYSYVIRMSLLCTGMSLVCHPYANRMYSYVILMSLVCGFSMNPVFKLSSESLVILPVFRILLDNSREFYMKKQRRIMNLVKHLTWSFLQK